MNKSKTKQTKVKVRNEGWESNGKIGWLSHYVWSLATMIEPTAILAQRNFHKSTITKVIHMANKVGLLPNKEVSTYINAISKGKRGDGLRWSNTPSLMKQLAIQKKIYYNIAKSNLK